MYIRSPKKKGKIIKTIKLSKEQREKVFKLREMDKRTMDKLASILAAKRNTSDE